MCQLLGLNCATPTDATFSFTGTNGIASQTLTTTASGTPVEGAVQTLTTVGQQTTITESGPPAGYTLTDASCTGLPTNGTATLNQATRTLTLNAAATAAGAELVCTFTNARAPVLRVSDAGQVHVGHAGKADGRWRLYAFAGNDDAKLRGL